MNPTQETVVVTDEPVEVIVKPVNVSSTDFLVKSPKTSKNSNGEPRQSGVVQLGSNTYNDALTNSTEFTPAQLKALHAFNEQFIADVVRTGGEIALKEMDGNGDLDRVNIQGNMGPSTKLSVTVDRMGSVRSPTTNTIAEVPGYTHVGVKTSYGKSTKSEIRSSRDFLGDLAKEMFK